MFPQYQHNSSPFYKWIGSREIYLILSSTKKELVTYSNMTSFNGYFTNFVSIFLTLHMHSAEQIMYIIPEWFHVFILDLLFCFFTY